MSMKYVFNVFTGNFDLINDGASIPSVQSETDLPATANDGSLSIVRDTDQVYIFNLGSSLWTTTGIVIDAVSGASDPAGITAGFETDGSVIRPTLTLHPADATNPGLLTTIAQDISGIKSFIDEVIVENGIDTLPSGTLNIGAANADVINLGGVATTITIGNNNATVIIEGTTEYQDVTNLNVADKLITINKGGSTTTGGAAGLEIEEASTITGYAKTSVDRNTWQLKAPNQAGIATIDAGSAGITLDQSSHDPVTIGTANGLSLSGQILSLAQASDSVTGALSSTDHTRFTADAVIVEAATASQTANTLVKRDSNSDTSVRHLLTSAGLESIDVENRLLVDSAGSVQINWDSSGTTFIAGNPLINGLNANRVVVSDSSKHIVSSATTDVEIGYVSGVTSSIQTQLTNKADRDAHDISLSSASLANNQASPANVTGLAFPNTNVRSAQIQYSATIITTGTSLYEEGMLRLTQRGADWTIARNFDGDDSLLNFDVTTAGQVTYTSSTYTGFVSGTLKYRATDTTV